MQASLKELLKVFFFFKEGLAAGLPNGACILPCMRIKVPATVSYL